MIGFVLFLENSLQTDIEREGLMGIMVWNDPVQLKKYLWHSTVVHEESFLLRHQVCDTSTQWDSMTMSVFVPAQPQ